MKETMMMGELPSPPSSLFIYVCSASSDPSKWPGSTVSNDLFALCERMAHYLEHHAVSTCTCTYTCMYKCIFSLYFCCL